MLSGELGAPSSSACARDAGRQGTCEMPLVWECAIGYVLGPVAERWQAIAEGVMIERCAWGADSESNLGDRPH